MDQYSLLVCNGGTLSYLALIFDFSLAAYATHSFPPEFQYPLPVDKKRSGMQVDLFIYSISFHSNAALFGVRIWSFK